MHFDDIPGSYVRYVSHVFYANVVNGDIVPPPIPSPYAQLVAETPLLDEPIVINVDHKIDFYNFWLLVEKGLHDIPEWEVLIRYLPAKGVKGLLKKIFPKLEYSVFDRGYLERLLSDNLSTLEAKYKLGPRFRFYANETE